jgi:type I restriction enzyme S subunit
MKEGWEYGILENAVDKASSNLSINKLTDEEGEYPLFGASGFVKNLSFYHQVQEYISLVKDGAGVGRVERKPAKSSVVGTLQYLIPKEGFDIDFIYYFLLSIDFKKYLQGSTIPHVYYKDYKGEAFPLLPLPEQERIVAQLDAAFAAIDKAKANVERNLHNAKELFQSKLNEVFENLESQYERTPIASVCKEIFAGGDAPRENFSEARTDKFHIPIIANAVKDHGLYGYTDLVRVSEPSITIAARGSGTGHTEIRLEPFFPIVRLIVLMPKREMIDLSFFCYSIKNLEILRSGSAIPQLTVPMIKGYSLAVPPLETQEVLVEMLNSLEGSLQSLETYYTRKLTELETLKKSVLERAFRGEI